MPLQRRAVADELDDRDNRENYKRPLHAAVNRSAPIPASRNNGAVYPAFVCFVAVLLPAVVTLCIVVAGSVYLSERTTILDNEPQVSKMTSLRAQHQVLKPGVKKTEAESYAIDYTKVFKPKQPFDLSRRPLNDDSIEYHVVFSTGCSLYQDWQSFVFFYQAWQSGQPGTVTRIVSGCSQTEESTARRIFDEQIRPMSPAFQIHFTPDFSHIKKGPAYPYYNKPFGTRHWLEHALGHPDQPVNEDAIVILMDPDQLILRPFTNNDFANTQWKFIPKSVKPRTKVEHGAPMAQMYGFALQWLDKARMEHVAPGQDSPVSHLTRQEAQRGFTVGPPYVATARDMHAITTVWSEFAPRVHDEYPYLLAEMFAYSLAAAHLQLPHQTAQSFMVSDVGYGPGEGWSYVDALSDDEICTDDDVSPEKLPNVLHFCQRYGWGPYFFGKRKLPRDFLTCKSPLLREPPADLLRRYEQADFPENNVKYRGDMHLGKRNVFALCRMIRVVNRAATYWKEKVCDPGEANFSKSLGLTKELQAEHLE